MPYQGNMKLYEQKVLLLHDKEFSISSDFLSVSV